MCHDCCHLASTGSETEYSVCMCIESWSPGVFQSNQSNQSNQMTVFESHFGIVFICLYLPSTQLTLSTLLVLFSLNLAKWILACIYKIFGRINHKNFGKINHRKGVTCGERMK